MKQPDPLVVIGLTARFAHRRIGHFRPRSTGYGGSSPGFQRRRMLWPNNERLSEVGGGLGDEPKAELGFARDGEEVGSRWPIFEALTNGGLEIDQAPRRPLKEELRLERNQDATMPR